jgi:hypothetical protein
VRKKARWFAPGGTIYVRTQPKPVRTCVDPAMFE